MKIDETGENVEVIRKTGRRKTSKRKLISPGNVWGGRLLLMGIEILCIAITGLAVLLLLFGYAARRFAGTDFIGNLLPFILSVAAITLGLSLSMILWWHLRKKLLFRSAVMVPLLAVIIVIGTGMVVGEKRFHLAYKQLRIMIGGRHEANRITLAHQIYAAYRRHNTVQLQKMAKRAEPYKDDIQAAAQAFGRDPDLLFGIAAVESSYYPRRSKDGGEGLFQLTSVPGTVEKQVASLLQGQALSAGDHRYNAFAAAATLDYYLGQMRGDLFLGLLAYNIGPANGGLRFIMEQYKVSEFISIQPYLQPDPRNYPIRVLSYALAFRIYHRTGQFLPYEEGDNAVRIQKIGIPGLDRF